MTQVPIYEEYKTIYDKTLGELFTIAFSTDDSAAGHSPRQLLRCRIVSL